MFFIILTHTFLLNYMIWLQFFLLECLNLGLAINALATKSHQHLNEVRVPQALPEYYIKYSQFENAKSDYLNRLSSKLSFEPSKPKGMSFYKIKEAF